MRQALIEAVKAIAVADGNFETAIPELLVFRRSEVSLPMACVYELGLGISLQGAKRVVLGEHSYDYTDGQSLVTSVDVPVASQITRASKEQPFYGIYLRLDAHEISHIVAEMDFAGQDKFPKHQAMSVVDTDNGLLDALLRLIQLDKEPQLKANLTPLIKKEIILRLLNSPHSPYLRQIVMSGSAHQKIAKTLCWLKENFTSQFSIDDLARDAHMSPSTFRLHFRDVVKMSPLQYVKNLRLQAARQLMLNERIDVGSAALKVGYESPSQFSREYTRFFGKPPIKDISALRLQQIA